MSKLQLVKFYVTLSYKNTDTPVPSYLQQITEEMDLLSSPAATHRVEQYIPISGEDKEEDGT